jgi:hypothetical protein
VRNEGNKAHTRMCVCFCIRRRRCSSPSQIHITPAPQLLFQVRHPLLQHLAAGGRRRLCLPLKLRLCNTQPAGGALRHLQRAPQAATGLD